MRLSFSKNISFLVLAWSTLAPIAPPKAAFVFHQKEYFHRWSKNNQHEFTPANQENLEKWADMITINAYPDADDGDALAGKANAVLENYQKHQGKVIKTQSVPRTTERPAEHLIVVMFVRPALCEAAFARFKLVDGKGFSFAYSHRLYGEEKEDEMIAWLNANHAAIEKSLMEWSFTPSQKALHEKP
jgi:hypothetical protein